MAIGEKQVSEATSLKQRTVIKWMALYVPVTWPTGVLQTRPELDQEGVGPPVTDFEGDLVELEALLDAMTARGKRADWPSHPFFGPMSGRAWLRWGYLHVDHHLRQFGA
jgi:Protein of unknown function (DUF1569)